MKNDLTQFEKNLLRMINVQNNTRFTYKNFMEWGSHLSTVQKNLEEGEKIYSVLGVHVAIKS